MQVRKPIVADQFYPGQRDSCLAEIISCIDEYPLPDTLPESIVAGILPHAGWVFSGSLAALVFAAIRQQHEKVNTFVIFGAAHGYYGQAPAVYDRGIWLSPLGEVQIDQDLAETILDTKTAVSNPSVHTAEHSIEVQVPFVQHLFPGAKLLPIITPPDEQVIKLGEVLGEIIAKQEKKIVCIGSTDLTHYGPRYGFAPAGTGPQATKWATEVNDKKFIDATLKLDPNEILTTAAENANACGPGAAAATVAVAKKLGKTQGLLIAHTNSNEVMERKIGPAGNESVGYAAIIF